ncbi:uncharacterized protein LOC116853629 [Odontomachus brunneus]|uniref:uncharacterized protein LOC116853629 n=1 Tax=Odontomachus brunneus TaxID=486640 RepID=UPI0013F266FC|nr:uncharacterized protein LOC116853629 [Odontomachus brunneus]
MAGSRRIQQMVRRAQRFMATCLDRAYRTTSHAAATALAGIPSVEFLAMMYAENYRRTEELRQGNKNGTGLARATAFAREQARQRLFLRWKMQLEGTTGRSGKRVADAIRPCLQKSVGRAHEDLTFQTPQVLTGHGCFGEYLHRVVRKECTSRCHHCSAAEDTAQHTLGVCPAWDRQRRVLTSVVGADLSPPALIRAILKG